MRVTSGKSPARRLASFGAAALALLLLGTAAAPPAAALDDGWLPNLIPRSQEAEIGAQQHRQVIDEFGGVYEDAELQAYVEGIGQRLAAASGTAQQTYTYTVLDSPIVNAFALPGGYIYVTRGLVALANNEAELAGVLAHEMGHVVARHSTQRMSRGVFAELGTAILGSVLDSPIATSLARSGAGLLLSGYSREQEREADSLGLQYMRGAGYPPIAVGAFLGTMGQMEELQQRLGGGGGQFALLATHPQNAERVQLAVAQAGGDTPEAWQGRLGFGRSVYLDRIDGMVYGESRRHGFVRDGSFLHPEMRFAFSVPAGFKIVNTPKAVVIEGPGNSQGIFDADMRRNPAPAGGDPAVYIRDVWTGGQPVRGLERISIAGLPAATAFAEVRSQAGSQALRLVAIRAGDRFYRFQFAAPAGRSGGLDAQFQGIARSFRQLSPAEAQRLQPLRLQVLPVRQGDTAASFAARSALEEPKLDRFRVLNGLRAGEEIAPGQRVKSVR